MQRLVRKSRRVLEIWEEAERDWNQTFHEMVAYAMGAPRNSVPFRNLASSVSYRMCLREKGQMDALEAMLLGAAGLLAEEYFDDHVLHLQKEFQYRVTKYDIKTMSSKAWDRSACYPAGHPIVRIVQWAAIAAKSSYSFDDVIGCCNLDDVAALLSAEVGDYWQKVFRLRGTTAAMPRCLGREKLVVMAINFVVPLQFAYAEVMQKEEVKNRAMNLLESLPAEHNRIVGRWTGYGVPCSSAFESQALLELQSYCNEKQCEKCPLAKQIKRA